LRQQVLLGGQNGAVVVEVAQGFRRGPGPAARGAFNILSPFRQAGPPDFE
jgi:hypothetical protein